MDPNFTNENDPWEYSLDIDDSDLNLTHVLRSSSSARVEPSPYTPNPVRIIPGPAGLVQRAKQLKENVFILDPDGALMSTQEYMQKVVEDVGEDSDFNSGAWISATNYVLSTGGTISRVQYVGQYTYGKDIHVGAAMILANVSVFTLKQSEHYLNITKKNVVKVFQGRAVAAATAVSVKGVLPALSSFGRDRSGNTSGSWIAGARDRQKILS
ncbi:probable transmembrane ascorbate ferrireductase 4 [Tanacetum coccineum]